MEASSSHSRSAAAFVGTEKAAAQLRANPAVEYVELDQIRSFQSVYSDDLGDPAAEQLTPYAIYQSQADQVTLDLSNAKKVCVVDSGLAGAQGETGGFNADFDWSVITGTSDSGTGAWNTDGGPHGTHVAGTIAAKADGILEHGRWLLALVSDASELYDSTFGRGALALLGLPAWRSGVVASYEIGWPIFGFARAMKSVALMRARVLQYDSGDIVYKVLNSPAVGPSSWSVRSGAL